MYSYSILLLIIIILLRANFKQSQTIKNLSFKCPSFVDNTIKFYGRDNCIYTTKMKQLLKQEKLTHYFNFIDILTEPGKSEFSKTNARGVPFFSYNNKSSSGFMASAKLFKSLNFKI